MADKKSILEEALLDIKNIQSALNANTKEILRSVAKEEIDGVVKESLTKEAYVEEEVEDSLNEVSHEEHEKSETPAEEKKEHGKGGTEKKEKSETKSESKMTEGEMPTEGMYEEEMEEGMYEGMYEEEMEEGMYEEGMDAMASEELDMTQASDDDVIAVYKKLSGDDEIEIVGDEIHLTVSEPGEYVIKTSDLDMGDDMDDEMAGNVEDVDIDVDDIEGGDDVDYEIEMDDEEGEPSDLSDVDDEEGEEEEGEEEETIEEAIPVGSGQAHRLPGKANIGQPKGAGADNLKESVIAKKLVSETAKKYNTLLTESKKLKTENEEFRKALKEFRTKLVETVVFNSNLTYVTRLFMEHATTKAEKQSIIKRFDEGVTNLKESKKLYRTIANELASRKPITEAIEGKIIKEGTTGSSKQLNESTAYVDPSTKRILDLIQRVENK